MTTRIIDYWNATDSSREGARAQMELNMNPIVRYSRMRHRRHTFVPAIREWGHEVARAIACEDIELLAELLSDKPSLANPPQIAIDMLTEADWFISVHSGNWENDEERVYIRNESGWVTLRQYESGNYYSCEYCDDANSGAPEVYTEDHEDCYCSERCAERNGCVCRDGNWWSDPDNAPDDDDDSDSDGIYSYCTYLGGLVGNGDKYNIGTEIEIEFRNGIDRRNFVRTIGNDFRESHLHCKHDGSLDSYGVEAVTGYGSWDDMSDIVAKMCEIALANKGRSHLTSTCGQHISVGRETMSVAQQARFVVFFNLPDNQEILNEFARRKQSSWAKVKPEKASDKFIADFSAGAFGYGDKYEAVNCNHHTHLEVRIFKGTLRKETATARMALVRLVAEYCEQDLTAKDMKIANFMAWVSTLDTLPALSVKEYFAHRSISVPALV